jgi:RNA recognition motif-containing protein
MKRLYVGNLPYATTKEDLEDRFGQHGELTDVKVITDRETGRSKGFAFVEFKNEGDAEAALSEDGMDFNGRPMRVKEAEQKERRNNDNGHRQEGRGGRPGSREGRGGRRDARE